MSRSLFHPPPSSALRFLGPRSPRLVRRQIRPFSAAAAPRQPSSSSKAFALLSVGALGLITAVGSVVAGISLTKLALPISGPIDTRAPPADRTLPPALHDASSQLTIIKRLTNHPDWIEIPTASVSNDRPIRLTGDTLALPRGIMLNRIFVHKSAQESTSILSLGTGLCGYPNVVHGGIIATVLDEALGRLALLQFPERNGVTAKLEVNYKHPTMAMLEDMRHGFVVVKTKVVEASQRKAMVMGTVEDESGRVLCSADGLFVVPKGYNVKAIGGV